MLRRDQRFVPEKQRIGRRGVFRLVYFFLAVSGGLALSAGGIWYAAKAFEFRKSNEVVVLEPIKEGWKRRPDAAGGRQFLNKGLEINHVQAELFDLPAPEEIVIAPPPEPY